MNEFIKKALESIKKNWKVYIIAIILIISVASAIRSGIIAGRAERDYRTAQSELAVARQKISDSDVLIGQLQSDNKQLTAINNRWAERDKRLEYLIGREEEIYRGVTAAITGLKGGLSTIQSGVNKLGNDNIQIKAELTGGNELVQRSLTLLQQLQNGSRKTDK